MDALEKMHHTELQKHPERWANLIGSPLPAKWALKLCLLPAYCLLTLCLLSAYHLLFVCLLHASVAAMLHTAQAQQQLIEVVLTWAD